jgi:hypothetical protein
MSEELVKNKPVETALERPSWMGAVSNEGKEGITQDDVITPRLALAQGLTPQVTEGKDGFKMGVMFNSVTEEIYGKGPINIIVLRRERPRWTEFNSRESGGGIKDMNIDPTDDRCKWGVNGEKPVATQFYDFIVSIVPFHADPTDSFLALSFSRTGIKVAKHFNGLITRRKGALYESVYSLSTTIEKGAKGTYAKFAVTNAGYINDEQTYKAAKRLFEAAKTKEIVIDSKDIDAEVIDDSMAHNAEEKGDTDFKM